MEASASECGRTDHCEPDLYDTKGDFYGGILKLCRSRNLSAGCKSWHFDSGCKESDAGISIPNAVPDPGTVYFDFFHELGRGRAGALYETDGGRITKDELVKSRGFKRTIP